VAYLLFPAFASLDVFGPLQALNLVSNMQPMEISLISADLNPIAADRNIINGVFQGSPDGNNSGAPTVSPYFTEYIIPTHTLEDAPELDVLMVPGGGGAYNMSGTEPYVDFIRDRFDSLQYMMTVCVGTSLLARSGKIAGKNATTNKSAFEWVKSVPGADEVNWIPKARWVVDGNVWTSSGVSAGTDQMLGWIAHVWGHDLSTTIKNVMEWNALNATEDPFAALYGLS
jgi:putative intracellular protease/amidase